MFELLTCEQLFFQIIYVQEAPLLGKDWLMGQRGTSRGKVPTHYVRILD